MHLRSKNVGPREGVWSDATGDLITGDVVEHSIDGAEQPMSRTSDGEAEGEAERLSLAWLFGLEQGGYSLHRLTKEAWPTLVGKAGFHFEGAEDGMSDCRGEDYMSIVGYGLTSTELPKRIEPVDEDDDFVWVLEKTYNASPECECPWCGTGTGNEASREDCGLCEGSGLLYHPYHTVYLYKQVSRRCQQCYHDYAPPEKYDDGFCGDDCKALHERELMGEDDDE